jgi:hypothetical protein
MKGTVTWTYPDGSVPHQRDTEQAIDRGAEIYVEVKFGKLRKGGPDCLYQITINKERKYGKWEYGNPASPNSDKGAIHGVTINETETDRVIGGTWIENNYEQTVTIRLTKSP